MRRKKRCEIAAKASQLHARAAEICGVSMKGYGSTAGIEFPSRLRNSLQQSAGNVMAASDSGTLRQLAKGGRNSARVGEAQRAHRRSEIQHGSLTIRDTRTDG